MKQVTTNNSMFKNNEEQQWSITKYTYFTLNDTKPTIPDNNSYFKHLYDNNFIYFTNNMRNG